MMKKNNFLIVLLIILACNIFILNAEANEKFVSSFSGLRLRDKADINSRSLDLIPFMDKVQIIEEKNETTGKIEKVKKVKPLFKYGLPAVGIGAIALIVLKLKKRR